MGKKQYVVIGLGRFGRAVCETLYENGAEVLAVDIRQDRVNDAVSYSTHAVCADASEEGVLRDLGIGNFDVAVVAIGNQIKASSMIALLLKEMGVGTVIARANAINDRPVVIDFIVSADAQVWPMVAAGVSNDEIQHARGMSPAWEEE